MKITHISLIGIFTDYWSYQDNLLPKYHKRLGHDVTMITSRYIYNKVGKLEIDKRTKYLNENGVNTIRLDIFNNKHYNCKFKRFKNLYRTLIEEKPDVLFIHGVQFFDIITINKFLKNNPEVVAYVDNHADFSNSATNIISKYFLHKFLWKSMAKLIQPRVKKFYGVLPSRCQFLIDMYNIPEEKVELLPLAADDDKIIELSQASVTNEIEAIKSKLKIKEEDFVIVTGGKIDKSKKQVLDLMKAVSNLNTENVKLIVFGSVDEDIKEELFALTNDKIIYYGWVNSENTYKIFSIADLAVFPGRHSVFWEEVAGMGIPLLVKYWEGMQHLNVEGNCRFIYNDKDIEEELKKIIFNKELYSEMRNRAKNNSYKNFLYSDVAKRSLI
ncbi:glycosyltransferase [Globicatella sanguinis]